MTQHFAVPVSSIILVLAVVACGSMTPTAATRPPGSTAVSPGAAAPATTTATVTATSQSPSASPVQSPSAQAATADWPVYHLNAARTGNSTVFPALTGSLSRAWSANLDGAVYGEPLVVSGHVIVATEGDSVYSLNPASGAILWHRNVGTPVPLSTLPCGNIDPLGITSTPAYDAASNTLFVVAEVTGPKHFMFALDPSNGTVRWSRNVDPSGDDPRTHQQRGALAVANGHVYFGFGGLAGDCGQYVGEEIGVPTSGSGATISYRVPVAREGAIWSTGGPVIDASGNLYVSTGNGSSTTTYDGSDSVVELSPSLHLISRFAPSNWANDNANDLDLGSLSPVLLPGGLVFIAGKRGTGYSLHQGALGGIGGQVSSAGVCGAYGGAAQSGSTVYVPCQSELDAVTVSATGAIHVAWVNSSAGGSPVVGGGAVWSLASGTLYALDPATGHTRASIAVGSLPHFASPTLWDGLVFVGTMAGVFAVASQGAVDHLGLSPSSATIVATASQAYTATAFDAGNHNLGDVTGTSTFTISGAGSCTGATCTSSAAGGHTVTATNGSAHGTATLDVIVPTLTWYHPIAPVRLLDTRRGTGLSGKLVAGQPRTLQVSGRGGIPAGATAITGNATEVNATAASSIYLGPTPVVKPPTYSMSFNKGQVANRGVSVALSSTGTVSVTYRAASGTTDLVLDVSGFFMPGTSGDTYHPLRPARVLDTRKGIGLATVLKANTPATFTVWGHGGVPPSARAVTGNVTVVDSSGGWATYLGPNPIARPGASTINFTPGQVAGNSLTVALSSTGKLSVTFMSSAGKTTDLVFDVTGYYTADATGLRYVALTPAPVLNTASGIGLSGKLSANKPASFTVRGDGGLPTNAAAITGVVSVVNQTNAWALFVGPAPATKPTTSSLNFVKGDVISNGVTVALSPAGALSLTYMSSTGNKTDAVLFVTGCFVK